MLAIALQHAVETVRPFVGFFVVVGLYVGICNGDDACYGTGVIGDIVIGFDGLQIALVGQRIAVCSILFIAEFQLAVTHKGLQVGIVRVHGVFTLLQQLDGRHRHTHRPFVVQFHVQQSCQSVGRFCVILQRIGIVDRLGDGAFPLHFGHTHLTQPRVGIASPVRRFQLRQRPRLLVQVGQRQNAFVVVHLVGRINQTVAFGPQSVRLLLFVTRRQHQQDADYQRHQSKMVCHAIPGLSHISCYHHFSVNSLQYTSSTGRRSDRRRCGGAPLRRSASR